MGTAESKLFNAAGEGDVTKVMSLLSEGANVNFQTEDGATPLYFASQEGRLNVVKALISHGAAIDAAMKDGLTSLYVASQNGHLTVVKALLERGASVNAATENGATPLCVASERGHLDIVKALISHGAAIDAAIKDGNTPLHLASVHGHLDILKLLLHNGANASTRNKEGKSVRDYHDERIKTFLDEYLKNNTMESQSKTRKNTEALPPGSTTNTTSTPPNSRKVNIAKSWSQLITEADPLALDVMNAQSDLNQHIDDGYTALGLATICNNVTVAIELILRGANIDKPSQCGYSPLQLACLHNRVEIAHLLLDNHANVNAVNRMRSNWTPLHIAAHYDCEDIVVALLHAGATPTLRSLQSELPQDCATSDRVKNILTQHTKKIEYDSMVHALIVKGDATVDELDALADNFTSVYDLRTMCSMANTIMKCSGSLTATSFKPVLVKVLTKIIDDKMVLDDHAFLFFSRMIDFCNNCGFFMPYEYEMWKHRALKVNVQNIEYLVEIMRQVQENTWRLQLVEDRLDRVESTLGHVVHAYRHLEDKMKNVFEQVNTIQTHMVKQQEHEVATQKQRRMMGFLSMALCFVGCPLVKELGDYVIDLANPIELLDFTMDSQSVDTFLETSWEKVDLKPMVNTVLEKIMLPKEDFVSLLQTSIRYETSMELDDDKLAHVEKQHISEEKTSTATSERAARLADLVKLMVKSRRDEEKAVKSTITTSTTSSTFQPFTWLQDIQDFIYHHAIEESKGNLEEYLEVVEYIDEDDDMNETIRVQVEGQEHEWTPLDFAVFMGYIEIVKCLLENSKVNKTAKPATYILQAKKRSRFLNEKS